MGKGKTYSDKLMLDKLGIKQLLCVIGGSVGGMQVLQWAVSYPDMVKYCLWAAPGFGKARRRRASLPSGRRRRGRDRSSP